ncbi:unnamed protein product, partial [Mesorhabditis spiculigera]
MGCCSARVATWVLALGGAVLVILGVVSLTAIAHYIDQNVVERSYIGYEELKNGSRALNEVTEKWIKPPFSMYLQIYMYNLENEAAVLKGAKPSVSQIGPFTFREVMDKKFLQFANNETEVFYRNTRTYYFDRTKSCPECLLTKKVTIPNIVFQKIIDLADSSFSAIIASIIASVGRETPYITVTAGEALFEGYVDPLIGKICSNPVIRPLCKGAQIPERIGFFYGQNNTDDGLYHIKTGLEDRSKLGKILSWNNMTILPETWWSNKQARMINGTDGQLFPPLIEMYQDRTLFAGPACRTVQLAYREMASVEGVPAYRFGVPDSMYDPTLPENIGFCNNATPTFFNDTRIQPKGCLPPGLLDISRCQPGNPRVYIGNAHFLGAPKEVHDAVIGIPEPDAKLDETIVDIEPTSGAVINAIRRAQINLGMRKGKLAALANTTDMIYPILWINETAYFDEGTKAELKGELWRAKHWVFGVGLSLIFGGVMCWLAFVGYYIVVNCCLGTKPDEEPLLTGEPAEDEYMDAWDIRTPKFTVASLAPSQDPASTSAANTRSFKKEWEKYQVLQLAGEMKKHQKDMEYVARTRSLNYDVKILAMRGDGTKIVQILMKDLQKTNSTSERLVVTEAYMALGKIFEKNIGHTGEPVNMMPLFIATINLLNFAKEVKKHDLAAGLLYLLMKLEKWAAARPVDDHTRTISREIADTEHRFGARIGFLNMAKVNAPFTIEDRGEMRTRLIQLTGKFEDLRLRPAGNDYDTNLRLVDTMRDPVHSEDYEGNPFQVQEMSQEKLEGLFLEQLSAEQKTWITMRNPCHDRGAAPAEEYLREFGWKEKLKVKLEAHSLKKGRNSFLMSLIKLMGAESVAGTLNDTIINLFAKNTLFIPRGVFHRTMVNALIMDFHKKYRESTFAQDKEVWLGFFEEYSRYFLDPNISRQYSHRAWWKYITELKGASSFTQVPYAPLGFHNYEQITNQLETILLDTITYTKKNGKADSKPLPVFSLKNISIEALQGEGDDVTKGTLVPAICIDSPLMNRVTFRSFSKLNFASKELPMVVPPRPWNDYGSGGPEYMWPGKVVRNHPDFMDFNSNHECRKRLLNPEQGRPVWDALNLLGSTPWKINQPMLDLLLQLYAMSKSRDNHALIKRVGLPMCPKSLPPIPSMEEVFGRTVSSAEMTDKMRKQYGFRRWLATKERNEAHSLRSFLLYRLTQANHFRNNTLYFPHNMDFRGRVYPISPHLSHMGDDVNRCILQFARGRPLGKNGLHWLKRHVINLTGLYKKKSVEERDRIADSLLPLIIDSAKRPLEGGDWWMESEDPFQTLAACIEIKNALEAKNPEEFVSHLPIHQDGSCNGLQHYAALGRDEEGAGEVNLLPAEVPGDVYTSVAKRVELKRHEDEHNIESPNHQIARALREAMPQEVPRKVIKQTVMTTVYGVTMYGAVLQIKKQLKAMELTGDAEKFAAYLAKKTFLSLHDAFKSSMDMKEWFRECAKGISQLHRTTEWVTPLGLPVPQPYLRPQIYHGQRILIPLESKQVSAFPPNYVHSLDSTHMMLTTLECARKGLTFAAVHDCYWTHAASVEEMNKLCRETFIRLHTEPLVDQLSDHFQKTYLPEDLTQHMHPLEKDQYANLFKPKVPPGDLDIEKVRDSVYFFS